VKPRAKTALSFEERWCLIGSLSRASLAHGFGSLRTAKRVWRAHREELIADPIAWRGPPAACGRSIPAGRRSRTWITLTRAGTTTWSFGASSSRRAPLFSSGTRMAGAGARQTYTTRLGRTAGRRSAMQTDTRLSRLTFEGRSPATLEYLALRDRHRELVQAARAVEQARDTAGERARRLSDELPALERARGAGEDVAAKITKTERR
jgi:hypothetical protein